MRRVNRRRVWGLVLTLSLALGACASEEADDTTANTGGETETTGGEAVESHPAISILQPQAPWLPSFEALVDLYQEETGNEVSLTVTPFNGMVERSLNAVQADESEFDILQLNSQWFLQFYAEGWVSQLAEIDPDFQLDPQIIEYDYQTRWNPDTQRADAEGDVYGLPINGNINLFFYRTDLYEENGLECPATWEEVASHAEALHNPPDVYGFAIRTNPPVLDYLTWLLSSGGEMVSYDEEADEWTVGIGSELAIQTLEEWLATGTQYGPPNLATLGQPDLISLMGSGSLAQVVLVTAAAADFQDPERSQMAGSIGACPVPGGTPDVHGAVAGIWLLGIPSNLPAERQEAAYAFMDWAMTKDAQVDMALAGGIPTRRDVYEELVDDPDIGWWVSAANQSLDSILSQPNVIPGAQLAQVVNTRVGQVVAGELEPDEALTAVAEEIHAAMEAAGYPMAPLP